MSADAPAKAATPIWHVRLMRPFTGKGPRYWTMCEPNGQPRRAFVEIEEAAELARANNRRLGNERRIRAAITGA